jgi:SAM-dependent methyltransferase
MPDISSSTVYELSSRGPLFRFLQDQAGKLVFSEYFDDVPAGSEKDGIPCQDVQDLTFPDQSFDLCTSTDVFEHVSDDGKAFEEIHRVLRPGGLLVFTVPLQYGENTVERAVLAPEGVRHILPAEYHDDHLRGLGRVLCYRNYGQDITQKLLNRGFATAEITCPDETRWWGYGRPVVVASAGND